MAKKTKWKRGDDELLLWLITYGKEGVRVVKREKLSALYDGPEDVALLESMGYIEFQGFARIQNPTFWDTPAGHVYALSATGLFRLNQLTEEN